MRLAWVYWRSPVTGATGHGELMPYDVAIEAAEYAAMLCPHVQHFVVEVLDVEEEANPPCSGNSVR